MMSRLNVSSGARVRARRGSEHLLIYNFLKVMTVAIVGTFIGIRGWQGCDPAWVGIVIGAGAIGFFYLPAVDKFVFGVASYLYFLWQTGGGYLADRFQLLKLTYVFKTSVCAARIVWNLGCGLGLGLLPFWYWTIGVNLTRPLVMNPYVHEVSLFWLGCVASAAIVVAAGRLLTYFLITSGTAARLGSEYEMVRGVFDSYFTTRAVAAITITVLAALLGYLAAGTFALIATLVALTSQSPVAIALAAFGPGTFWGIWSDDLVLGLALAGSVAGVWFYLVHRTNNTPRFAFSPGGHFFQMFAAFTNWRQLVLAMPPRLPVPEPALEPPTRADYRRPSTTFRDMPHIGRD